MLDRPQHDALDEVPLQEGVNAEDGHRGGDDRRPLHGFLGYIHQAVYVHRLGICGHDDIPQIDLQGKKGAGVDIDERVKIGIPVAYRIEQGDGRDGRKRKGNHDAQQDADIPGSVDLCRFLQAVGDGVEIIAEDDHVEGSDQAGDDQRPEGIHQPGVPNNQIGGNKSAGKEHGENIEEGDELPALETVPADDVRDDHGQADVDDRADRGDAHGNQQGLHEAGTAQHHPVRVQAHVHRPQEHVPREDRHVPGKGFGDDVQVGKQAEDHDDNQSYIIHRIEQQIPHGHTSEQAGNGRFPATHGPHQNIPRSPKRLLMKFAVTRRRKPMIEENRPTAVVKLYFIWPRPMRYTKVASTSPTEYTMGL